MRTLDRYIGKTIIGHTAVVMVILLSMYFFSAFIDEMGDVGKGNYSMADAVIYSIMLIPRQAYEIFALVALMGTMLGLGTLAGNSELTVMRAAGISVRQVSISVIKVGLLMVFTISLVGETLAPALEKEARLERAKAVAKQLSFNAGSGLWARDENTFIHMTRLLPDGRASGIELYNFDDASELRSIVQAKRADHEEDRWLLYDVTIRQLDGDKPSVSTKSSMSWRSNLSPEVAGIVAVPPENLSIWDLYNYLGYLQENGLDTRRYALSMWTRITAPFAAAGMVLLAVPFVFGSMRSVGVGQRVMVGALIGIGFYLFNAIFSRMGILYDLPPWFSATLPTVIVFLAWAWLMRRVV